MNVTVTGLPAVKNEMVMQHVINQWLKLIDKTFEDNGIVIEIDGGQVIGYVDVKNTDSDPTLVMIDDMQTRIDGIEMAMREMQCSVNKLLNAFQSSQTIESKAGCSNV